MDFVTQGTAMGLEYGQASAPGSTGPKEMLVQSESGCDTSTEAVSAPCSFSTSLIPGGRRMWHLLWSWKLALRLPSFQPSCCEPQLCAIDSHPNSSHMGGNRHTLLYASNQCFMLNQRRLSWAKAVRIQGWDQPRETLALSLESKCPLSGLWSLRVGGLIISLLPHCKLLSPACGPVMLDYSRQRSTTPCHRIACSSLTKMTIRTTTIGNTVSFKLLISENDKKIM